MRRLDTSKLRNAQAKSVTTGKNATSTQGTAATVTNDDNNSNNNNNNNNSNSSSNSNDAARRQKIREALQDLESKDNIQEAYLNSTPSPKYLVLPNGKAMMLQISKRDINQNVEQIMPVDETNIYPGCIVYANSELMAGKPQEVKFGVADQLGTVTVYVNFDNGGECARHGVKAQGSSIRQAISELLKENEKNGNTPPAQIQSRRSQYNSVSKMAVDMGCSVDYVETKCSVNASTSIGAETMYDMQSFSQAFYTVTIEPEDKDDTNFFGTGVTGDIIKKTAQKGGPIAIIKSVTYGRSGFYKKEFKATDFTFTAEESVEKSGVGVNSKQDISQSSKSTNEMGRVFGGSATTAGKALTEESFLNEMMQNMEVSSKNQGVPIYYTVQFLASGKQCTQKQTGSYEEIDYVPLTNMVNISINNKATTLQGTKSVEAIVEYQIMTIPGTGDECTVSSEKKRESRQWSNNSEQSIPLRLGEHQYFYKNELHVMINSRLAASAGLNKWKSNDEGWVNVPSNGFLDMRLEGNYRKYSVTFKGKDGKNIKKGNQ